MKVFRTDANTTSLLANGDFEKALEGKPQNWIPGPNGFSAVRGEGRNESSGLRVSNSKPEESAGGSQTLTLNRSNAGPLRVTGWSKAQDVSGSSDTGYSLYVDIIYNDGTPLWGQTANFRTGSHAWEQREFLILPEKPVRTLTLHCLFRGHTGTAWFDDVTITELSGHNGAVVFQGVPVTLATGGTHRVSSPITAGRKDGLRGRFTTEDGMSLSFDRGEVQRFSIREHDLVARTPSGFFARDAASGSDFYPFVNGTCPELGLSIKATCQTRSSHLSFRGRVSDASGKDRAIILVFAVPVDATGWFWGDDIRRSKVIKGGSEYANTVRIGCGSTGTLSLYPLSAIWNDRFGVALGLDMSSPAQYRLAYNAGTKQLFIAYDFGLVRETTNFPSAAGFSFVMFQFDPQWGYRSAFDKYMQIFPEHFYVRSKDQGIWMPFTDISTVQGWEDFGFKYHEGNNNVAWDDAHGILSFRYTEPMTWWMRMERDIPRTVPDALRIRDRLLAGNDPHLRRMAQVSEVAGMWDESGHPALSFRDTPWCNGAVWSLNPNPQLPARSPEFNAASVYWNPSVKTNLYGPETKTKLDGEYLDSLEGYVTADLNFRREHFRYTTVPLTFASDTKRPGLHKGLAVFELTRWLSEEVHKLGKLTFANGVPYRFSFLCPWLDLLGTETDWLREGKYSPVPDAQMSLWRTMSGAKPYLLLMNTDYAAFTPELVEKYFQRSLFYGMFPSMFSHNAADNPYWKNPKWYDRDRGLFKKYIPLIKLVAQGGWQPVTGARCGNKSIYLERFGSRSNGIVYLTVFNETSETQSGTIELDLHALGAKQFVKGRDLVSNEPEGMNLNVTLRAQQGTVFEIQLDPE